MTPEAKKRRILIVDDEQFVRALLSEELAREGYATSSAADGKEAVATLNREAFDLLLLDINMPNLDGIEVLKILGKSHPSTKAIILTGFANLKYAMEARQYGAADFISKPFNMADVLSTIQRVLND